MKKHMKFGIRSHLWIKIFSVVFAAVIILMMIFMIVWQRNNIKYIFEREEENIIENQSYISSTLLNAVSFAVLSEGVEVLPENQLKTVMDSALYYNMGRVALYREENLIASTYQEKDSYDYEILQKVLSSEKCYLQYYDLPDFHFIKTVSALTLQGQEYKIITTTNISELYEYEEQLMRQVMFLCAAGGLFTAVVLLFIFKLAFKPLKEINDNVKTIAAGNYDQRLDIRRSDELGQLARNVNEMAQAVGENIESLQEAASQQKRFVHNLSHEMKTPLTSIICYSEIMMANEHITKEKIIDYAEIILTEGRRLKMISEKLMDFLYIGKINECDKTEVSMEATLNDICNTMAPIFAKKNIKIVKKIDDFVMSVDLELFKTMVYNYLDNAVKASGENDIVEIHVYQEERKNIIEILDHGIGIADEEIAKIEEPFYMVDKSRSRKEGGSGLGLALCKKIVTAHQGEVKILSRLREGTTIKIEFHQSRGASI